MRRFAVNRWWVLVLATTLAIGTLPALVSPAHARVTIRQAQMGGSESSYGDPDIPNGTPYPGRLGRAGGSASPSVGDSRMATENGASRLRIVLEFMRAILFR